MAIAGLLADTAALTGSLSFPALGAPPRLGRDVGVVFQDSSGSLNPVLPCRRSGRRDHRGASRVGLGSGARPGSGAYRRARGSAGAAGRAPLSARILGRPAPAHRSGRGAARSTRLLIADEPTSALDRVVQRELATPLDELVREQRLTLLFVTHDIALASELADEVACCCAAGWSRGGPGGAGARPAVASLYTRPAGDPARSRHAARAAAS